jgi:hypothetical protein
MLRVLVAAVAVLAVAGGLAFWAYVRGDDSAEADVEVIRWVNVTVSLPEDSGLSVVQTFWGPRTHPPVILIRSQDRPESVLVIHAETGTVVKDSIMPEDRTAADELLKTVTMSPLDPSTAPWPYSGEPPGVRRETRGNITYIRPDPASGIRVVPELGIGVDGPSSTLNVHNGRSAFWIDVMTGKATYELATLNAADKEIFDRFLSAVEYVGP